MRRDATLKVALQQLSSLGYTVGRPGLDHGVGEQNLLDIVGNAVEVARFLPLEQRLDPLAACFELLEHSVDCGPRDSQPI